jgi:2-methylisocitrate lyase-like PEP mutase family enzyme
MTQADKARLFLELHRTERPLVLPNAWDVASARIFEEAGFPAIATTSAGIANALGYPDGQRIPRSEMLDMVARIAHATRVPVTADMEAGYGDVAETARGVIEAGAVGFNLEDGNYDADPSRFDPAVQCSAIRRAREVGESLGIPLVINARTDVFLGDFPVRGGVGQDQAPTGRSGAARQRFNECLRRLRAYAEAGAQSLFVPGLRDEVAIGELVRNLDRPLNILVTAGSPTIARLRELGVARVTVGSGAMRAVMGLTQRIARDLRETGSTEKITAGAMSFADANALFVASN